MTAAVINFKDLGGLPLKALYAMAKAAARDIDQGANKHDLLERVMKAIKNGECNVSAYS